MNKREERALGNECDGKIMCGEYCEKGHRLEKKGTISYDPIFNRGIRHAPGQVHFVMVQHHHDHLAVQHGCHIVRLRR